MNRNSFLIKSNLIKEQTSLLPSVLIWQYTLACNSSCLHCYANAGKPLLSELTTQESLRLAESIVSLRIPKVVFTGGEPFLRPDFLKILQIL